METLVTHCPTYSWFTLQDEVVKRVAEGQLQPDLPLSHFLAQTLRQCVHTDAAERTRFDRLVESLSSSPMGLAAALQPPGPMGLTATVPAQASLHQPQARHQQPYASQVEAAAPDEEVTDPRLWMSASASTHSGAQIDAEETGIDLADLEVEEVSRRRWWSTWCAHLEPSQPPVVAADLLGAADSQLSFLCTYKSRPLEIAYREHRYFCCAKHARWTMDWPAHALPRAPCH